MPTRLGLLLLTVSILSVLPLTQTNAQATPPDTANDANATRLQAVTVTRARAAGVVGGASAVVVRPVELRSSPAPTLEQALRESPFIHVRQNSRGEMELSVRGSDSRQAAVLLDGVPITLGWDHRTDPSLIPITGTRSLVIVRGLGSLLNGPNTLGGSIEVSHADVAGMVPGESHLWGGGGVDENAAFVTTVGGSRTFGAAGGGTLLVEGGVAYRDRDGYTVPGDAGDPTASDGLRTNSDLRHSDGFASLRWRTPTGASLGLTVSAFNAERGVPPEEGVSEPRLWRYPYHRRTIAALSAGSGQFATPFGYGSLEAGVGYNAGKIKIESFTDRTYQTLDETELGDERTMTGRVRLTHTLGAGTLRAAVTVADVRYTETLPPATPNDYRQTLFSGGAEIEQPLGLRTRLAGGVVFDKATTPETGGRTPGQAPFDAVGWRAGLSHELSSAVRLHASVSERSRFPALRELYSGALNRFLPNPDLEPETLLGFEAGVTLDRTLGSSRATFQLTGFRHNLDDAVVRITLPDPDNRFQRINRDRIESTGAELLAGFVFGPDATRAVTLTGDALLQNISIHDQTVPGEPAHRAENNPEQRGSVELGLPLPWDLRGLATARYTGTQYCLHADTGNEVRLSGRTRSDLALERTFNLAGQGVFRALRALVSLDNVSNATVYDQCGLPQPGRTLRVMFSIR